MGTAAARAGAKTGEGRLVDPDHPVGIIGRENAALGIDELAVDDVEIAMLEADARAITVGHGDMGEGDALDMGGTTAQHQRRLAFAGHAVEDHRARLGADIGDATALLDRAVAVAAGSNIDRTLAI